MAHVDKSIEGGHMSQGGTPYRETPYAAQPIDSRRRRERTWVDDLPRYLWANRWMTQLDVFKSGWVTEKGKHADLDQLFGDLKTPFFQYKHKQGGDVKNYWHIGDAHFFVILTRVDRTNVMDADLNNRHGVAYARAEQGEGASSVHCIAFHEDLVDQGYTVPVHLSASKAFGYNGLLAALIDHYEVLKQFKTFANWDQLPAFYDVSVGLYRGDPVEIGTQQSAWVVPIRGKSAPDPIDKEYLRQHYLNRGNRKALIPIIENLGDSGLTLVDEVIEWSISESQWMYDSVPDKPRDSTQGSDPKAQSYLKRGQPRGGDDLL
jgi:hypothetical protein